MQMRKPLKWRRYVTRSEQCHSKQLLVVNPDGTARLISGSANFTRRNLDNFNVAILSHSHRVIDDLVLKGP